MRSIASGDDPARMSISLLNFSKNESKRLGSVSNVVEFAEDDFVRFQNGDFGIVDVG